MATEPGTVRAAAAARGDTFVADRLARTEQRIRTLDLATAGLVFLAGTCAYAAVMVAADGLLAHAEAARQLLFFAYLVGAAAYLAVFVVRPLTRRINPYFTARQVERTLPGAKNSVVNWVDLHDQPLPAAIRNALGLRAAKDLAHADLERAVSGRRAGVAGGLAGLAGGVLFALLLWMGGGPFFDGIGRAFAPFSLSGVPRTRTRLTIVRPEPADATVPVGRPVTVAVEVEGKLPDPHGPDAVRLLYRYGEDDPWLERPMTEEARREFSVSVSATEVQSGFWYKSAGGDFETEVHRIGVRATPHVAEFQATYHFPKYAAVPKETRRERTLRAVKGSEVVVWALTNRTVKDARLDFDGKAGRQAFAGQRVPGDLQAFQVHMPLKESGLYRLVFTSAEGDVYSEPLHPVEALADLAPEVQLAKPGADVALPANGLLTLEGRAVDDFGVRELTLRMKAGERVLKPRPYRTAEALRLPGGGYPLAADYRDAVDLAKLEAEDADPFRVQPGLEVEYWLEAADACEPTPNVGSSRHYRVRLGEPQKDEAKRQQEREKAKTEQQQHEAAQDKQLKQESDSRQEQSREADKQEQQGKQQGNGENKGDPRDKGNPSGQPEKKDGTDSGGNGQPQKKDDPGAKGNPSEGEKGEGDQQSPEQQKQDAENTTKAQKLKDALNKNQEGQKGSPDTKPEGGKGNEDKQSDRSENGRDQSDRSQSPEKGKPDPAKGDRGGSEKQEGGNTDPAGKPEGKEGANRSGERKDSPGEREKGGKDERKEAGNPEGKDGPKGKEQSSGDKDGNPMGKPDAKPGESKPREGEKRSEGAKPGDKKEKGNPAADKQSPDGSKPESNNPAGKDEKTPAREKPDGGKEQSPGAKAEEKPEARQGDEGNRQREGDPKSDPGRAGKGEEKRSDKEATPRGGTKSESAAGEKKPGEKGSQATERPNGSEGEKNGTGQRDAGQAGKQTEQKAGEPGTEGGAKDAKPEDARKAARDLRSGDRAKREEAAKKLDRMSKEARDAETREEARKALEQKPARENADPAAGRQDQPQTKDDRRDAAGTDPSGKPGDQKTAGQQPGGDKSGAGRQTPTEKDAAKRDAADKSGDTGEKADGKSGEKSDRKPGDRRAADGAKPGEKSTQEPGAKPGERPGEKPGEKGEQSGEKSRPSGKTGQKDDGTGTKGSRPGEKPSQAPAEDRQDGKANTPPDARRRDGKTPAGEAPGDSDPDAKRSPDKLDEPPAASPPASPQKPRHMDKNTELQLEDLDKVTKKELDAANLTEKDLVNLRQWLREQRNRKPKADPKEAAVAPQRGGTGPAFGGQRVQPGTAGKPNDLSGGTRALPPPGYREANETFKRLLNKPDAGGK